MTPIDKNTDETRRTHSLSRRSALKMMLSAAGALAVLGSPLRAFADDVADATAAANDAANQLAETQSQLDAAQSEYDSISAQLTQIQNDYEDLAKQQANTLSQIEDVQKQIDATQEDIDEKQADLDQKRQVLGARMASSYKAGNDNLISIVLNSDSFEDLFQNVYYLDKITAADNAMIQEVKAAKDELDAQKAALEDQKSQLDALNQQQTEQMNQMAQKQQEVADLLANADSAVQQLLAQKDADLVAYNNAEQARQQAEAAAEAERQRQAAAAAAAAAASSGSYSGSYAASGAGAISTGGGNGSLSSVLSACSSTPSPGYGYCAAWVTNVFQNAGVGYFGGNACDMYASWCGSSSRGDLQPGMIIAVSSHNLDAAGRIYGHIGIYVGNGTVMDNIGYIRSTSVDSWISTFSGVVPARWGWLGGVVLA